MRVINLNKTLKELYDNRQIEMSINVTSEMTEYDSTDPLSLVITFTVIYAVIFVGGLVGNISTCLVITKNKFLHTATNYYLFSLACSDLLLLVSGLPPEMYKIWSPNVYVFHEAFCIIQGLTSEISANATVLTITAFTVERYIAICHPFLSQNMTNLSRAVRYIVIIWIIAVVLAIPQAVQFGVEESAVDGEMTRVCTLKNQFIEHAFEISTFIIFVGPMTLISALYILIGIQLHKSKKMEHCRSVSTRTKDRKGANRSGNEQRKIVKMLIAVVSAFFICWAPFHAQRLLAIYLSAAQERPKALIVFFTFLTYISGLLYYVSTTVNPLLYHLMSKKFRKAFKETFSSVCGCKNGPGDFSCSSLLQTKTTANTEFTEEQRDLAGKPPGEILNNFPSSFPASRKNEDQVLYLGNKFSGVADNGKGADSTKHYL